MTINRLIDIANLRQEIAIAAARMIAEEGTSYEVAKRKAARQVLGNSRITGEILPDNLSVEKEVKLYNELFLADSQPARLLHLRTLSLKLMQELEEFNPYITGAILNGTGGEHTDIHLQLFTDNVKDVEIFLLNRGIDFDVSELPHFRGKGHTIETIHFMWHDEIAHLSVYESNDIRKSGKLFGANFSRTDINGLRRLIMQGTPSENE